MCRSTRDRGSAPTDCQGYHPAIAVDYLYVTKEEERTNDELGDTEVVDANMLVVNDTTTAVLFAHVAPNNVLIMTDMP